MTDTPGWASPGSAPSDGQESGTSGPADAAGRPDAAPPADPSGEQPQGPGVKWSKEQPAPGQWSAPTGAPAPGQAPPPPAGPGWGGQPPAGYGPGGPGAPGHGPGGYGAPGYGPGGYGAWGAGWGGPPPAAKPGVIPLRPLGVGEILDGTVSTMRAHWRTVLGITLAVAVFSQIIVILMQRPALDSTANSQVLNDPNATADDLGRAMGDAMLGTGAVLVISLVFTVIATALLTTVTSRAVLGKPVTTAEAWRDARPQVLKLFGLVLLLLVICLGVFAVGMLPGILVAVTGSPAGGIALAALGGLGAFLAAVWLAVRYSLASPALMLEKQGIGQSMSRSAKLVRGSWWRVFGIQLLAGLIAGLISAVIAIPFLALATAFGGGGMSGLLDGTSNIGWAYLIITGIGSVIGSTVTFPITAGVTVLLYVDLRIRREALDLDLARAAGVQGHGSDAPASGS
ncbi:glycerophosphoryl diester phosphodiesterase membrane domain-containing protein [Streptomyces sp. NPDC014889]|uniref:glycerophosphoryl diester phosphodiesterase membrane domain-containing protein n=1 Tax=Streptomyces sp. NPDC014889 TaxID=3364928 RepID=UPI0036FB2C82